MFEYIPDFSLEGYQSVTVEKPSFEVSDEEFQDEIEQLRESRATIEPVEEDRALDDGDWAQISYKGQIEGEAEAAPVRSAKTRWWRSAARIRWRPLPTRCAAPSRARS